jgi:UDP-N-acetylmuramoyl-tripeptide--D-alanyl-D-alanine ligase
MAELGPAGRAYHRELGTLVAELGVDALVAVGELARGYLDGAAGVPVARWAATPEDGLSEVETLVRPGDCMLVKGSRAVGLESVAEALAAVRL